MKTAILLGAGTSVPAGYPTTKKLTRSILCGCGIKRNSDGTYQLTNPEESRTAVRLVNCAVRRIHKHTKRYFESWKERPPNYEDLFYVAKQLSDEELGEIENPAIGPFASQLRDELSPLIEKARGSGPRIPQDFAALYDEVCRYIAGIVWRKLISPPTTVKQLEPIVKACESGRIIGIATLCHDTHVETHVVDRGLALADGFSDPRAGVRYWTGDFSSVGKIPFVKLHGSVDWFNYRIGGSKSFYDDIVGIAPKDVYPIRFEANDGKSVCAVEKRPLLLIGTFNKLSQYSEGMFRDLHYQFRMMLRNADRLLICGYSFGDKGINSEIIEWFFAKRGRSFLIIHPNSENLFGSARIAIRKYWEKDPLDGSAPFKDAAALIEKRLEDVAPEDVLAHL